MAAPGPDLSGTRTSLPALIVAVFVIAAACGDDAASGRQPADTGNVDAGADAVEDAAMCTTSGDCRGGPCVDGHCGAEDAGTDANPDVAPDAPERSPQCGDGPCLASSVLVGSDFTVSGVADEPFGLSLRAACVQPRCEGACPTVASGVATFPGGHFAVDLGGGPPLPAFSVAAWVRFPGSEGCQGETQVVASGADESGLGFALTCGSSGRLTFAFADAESTIAAVFSPERTLAQPGWHLVAAVRDGISGRISLWVDGRRVGTRPVSFTRALRFPEVIEIGGTRGGSLLSAELSGFALYRRALGETELELLTAAGPDHALCDFACPAEGCSAGYCDALTRRFPLAAAMPPYRDAQGGPEGTCTDTCPLQTAGQVGEAQAFDGSEAGLSYAASDDLDFGPQSPMTWSIFVRGIVDETCENGGDETFLSRRDDPGDLTIELRCLAGSGRAHAEVCDVGGTCVELSSKESIIDGDWHLVTLVFDPVLGLASLYVDQHRESWRDVSFTTSLASEAAPVTVGWSSNGPPRRFSGALDEATIFDAALSCIDVANLTIRGDGGEDICGGVFQTVNLRLDASLLTENLFFYGGLGAFNLQPGEDVFVDIPAAGTQTRILAVDVEARLDCGGATVEEAFGIYTITPTNDPVSCRVISPPAPGCPGGVAHWLPFVNGNAEDRISETIGRCSACPLPTEGVLLDGAQFDNTPISFGTPTTQWGPHDPFSIEVWVRKDRESPLIDDQVIVGREDVTTQLQWWLGISADSANRGVATFFLRNEEGEGGGDARLVSRLPIIDGQWHHLAVVRDANEQELRLYVDGELDDFVVFPFDDGFTSTADLDVGHLNSSRRLLAEVDELLIWSRPLPAARVRLHHVLGRAGQSPCID